MKLPTRLFTKLPAKLPTKLQKSAQEICLSTYICCQQVNKYFALFDVKKFLVVARKKDEKCPRYFPDYLLALGMGLRSTGNGISW